MPTSKLSYALPVILAATEALHDKQRYRILDVGPGRGKYGLLCREYLPGVDRIDAVEAEPRYLTPRLRAIYDQIILNDVRALHSNVLDRYDLVLMVDVIEHLTLEEGTELLARIKGHVIVTTPTVFFQNPEAMAGWPTEEHRSLWRLGDFPKHRVVRAEVLAEEGLLVWLSG